MLASVNWNWLNVVLGVVCSVGFLVGFAITVARWITHTVARVAADKSGIDEFAKEVRSAMTEVRDDMKTVTARLDGIESQYRNNGGSSARDLWDRVEESLRHIRSDVLRIDKSVERHLGFHDGIND